MVHTKDFEEFAQRFYPWFIRDDDNKQVIELLIWYMNNDPRFEEKGYCLGKGICLVGNPGTGKSILMYVMQKYCIATDNELKFRSVGVPELAENFAKTGYAALELYTNGNCFYDELGVITRERVQYMGNKIVMGDTLIHHLEKKFTYSGNIFHFTTNCPIEIPPAEHKYEYSSLREIYEGRTVDRIYGMCNIIPLIGKSRRKTSQPVRRIRMVAPAEIPAADDIKKEIIELIIDDHTKWIRSEKSEAAIKSPVLYYDLLEKLHLIDLTREEKSEIFLQAKKERAADLKTLNNFDGNLFGISSIIKQYAEGADLQSEELIKVQAIAKRISVTNFFIELEIKGTHVLSDLLKENALNEQQTESTAA